MKVLGKLVRYFFKKLRLGFKPCNTHLSTVLGRLSTKKLFPSTHTIWNYISYLSIFLPVYQYLLRHCYHCFLFLQTQLQIEQTTIHPEHFFKGVITIKCHRYRTKSSSVIEYNTMCKPFVIRLQRCGYLKKKYIKRHLLRYNFTSYDNFYKKPKFGTCNFYNSKNPQPQPPPPKKRTQINIYPIPSILLQRVFS